MHDKETGFYIVRTTRSGIAHTRTLNSWTAVIEHIWQLHVKDDDEIVVKAYTDETPSHGRC